MFLFHPAAILLLKHSVGKGGLQQTENVIFITDNMSEVVVSCFGSVKLEWVGPSGTAVSMSSDETVYQTNDSMTDAQKLIIRPFTLQYSGNYTCRSSGTNLEKSILITMSEQGKHKGCRLRFLGDAVTVFQELCRLAAVQGQ